MSVTLPYYKDDSLLPSALPIQREIATATKLLPTIRSPDYDGRIVVIRDQYVVKYGTHVLENEGHALLFIEQHLSIPAPRLYAMYREGEKLYIIMQFIPGVDLQSLWPSLSNFDKKSILGELRCIFDEIRSLPPKGFFGGVMGGPVPHRYFYSREKNPAITGPFEREEGFHLAIAERSRQIWTGNNRHGWISDFFARNLPIALKGHGSVFTHSDLCPQNIIIQIIDSESSTKRYRVGAIIDWETAGWYPTYWEFAATFALLQWFDDWPESLEKILDPWPLEGAMLRFVHQDLEF
ncbi:hypothetical protein MauCBS54593_003249 [Microsporum audouinii]